MLGRYIQRGETIDYVNNGGVQIPAGTVVGLGTRVGIAAGDIPVGATGALHIVGVFEGQKAEVGIAKGAAVYYDPVADNLTNVAAGNIPAGWAIDAVLPADTDVRILLLGLDAMTPIAAAVNAVAAADTVAVAAADAAAAADPGGPDKDEFDAVVTLANANKAVINTLVTLANANKAQLNAVIAAMKAAGLMAI